MGADFTFAICKIPINTEAKMILSGENLKRAVKQRFTKFSVEDDLFLRTLEDCGVCLTEEEENNEELVAQKADEVADFLESGWQGRDTATLSLEGGYYFITGGMSWGDEPTDSFGIINLIDALGITEVPFTDEELA